jgi:hypothetical protein
MRPFQTILLLLITVTPFLACEYKADPTDGVQYCADSYEGQQCPDNYECLSGRCYRIGNGPGPTAYNATGGVTSWGSGGVSGSPIPPTGGVVTYPGTGGTPTKAATGGTPVYSSSSGGSKVGTGGGATSVPVTFQYGQAVGAITGYGWIALGVLDRVTDPTCGYSGTPITPTTPCMDVTNWNSATALCVSGYIPALPAVPTATDYSNNWGIQIGVNSTPAFGIISRVYSTISASISGLSTPGFRLELHRLGDPDSTTYCYEGVTSGMQVPLIGFNTACWDSTGSSGIKFAAADAALIDKVGVQISSLPTAITLTNMCLNGFTFGN